MSTGNTAKRRHLELPSSNINITSSKKKTNISSVYAVKPNTKRNLMSQLNDQSGQVFARPQTKHIISHVTPSKSRKVSNFGLVNSVKYDDSYHNS